ncbi:MAG: hypothetical protein ACYTGQ_15415 [Planctomycetota bacterium]|jgi:type II secretory pathway pseudopilin PulG
MQPNDPQNLTRQEQDAIDALVESNFDPTQAPQNLQPHTRNISDLLSTLDHLPDENPGDLLAARTLQRIDEHRQHSHFAQQVDALASGAARPAFRLRDIGAIAAMMILSVSVIMPLLSGSQQTAQQVACQANLGLAARAFSLYANDNNNAMPATKANLGDPWWLTNQFNKDGSTRSNSAHLFVLVSNDYLDLKKLACSNNENAQTESHENQRDWNNHGAVSYSYQNQFTSLKPKLDGSTLVALLADKNPFFEPGKYNLEMTPLTNSANHERQGQNVLLTNGSVIWLTTPLYESDNIFHAGDDGLDYYTGLEAPATPEDAFLVP